jgi:hypothetical protein
MPAFRFLCCCFLILCLATWVGCAYSNVKVDDDDHPVFNTGVGATILYPGQSPAMPPAHPGHQLPGGAPLPGDPGARSPHGQPLPPPSGTLGGAPTSTVQRGPGSTATSSGGGGISFIGGGEVDQDVYREIRQEPKWLKYLLAPFAIAAYPFVAVYNAVTKDDGPPPAQTAAPPTSPSLPPPAPVDVQTQYEQSQLEALERELAGKAGSQPAATRPPPAPRRERLAPSNSSIAAELAALQRGIPPRLPGVPSGQARSARSEAQPSGVQQEMQSAPSEAQPSGVHQETYSAPGTTAARDHGGIADQVTDRNRDGRPDHWVYRHAGQPVRELFDEDADGAPDRYVFYEKETGEKSREEEDTDLDGRIDSWLEYQNAKIARHRRDTNGDGFLDTWSFYRNGELARQERDLNGDGFRDMVGFYQGGRLLREEEDRDGDGGPDRVTLYDEQERIRQRDEDRNGDGIVDLRSFYSEGRLIRRELVDEEVEERIEEEDLASAAWSSGQEDE